MSPISARHDPELEPDAIRAALDRIHPAFTGAPQFVHEGLSLRAGVPVVVKVESVNPIRSFKGRGTWLAVREMAGEGRIGPERAVVAASTGNFGQGLAFAGRSLGIPVVVFADEHANPGKLARMRAFGATVIQSGRDFDAARAESEAYVRANDAVLLVDGEEPWVATGAGTLAVELTDGVAANSLPPLATAHIPVGNGALIVGMGAWLRAASPHTRIVGVQSEAAPSMTESWLQGIPVSTETAATFAEGMATRVTFALTFGILKQYLDDFVLLSEDELAEGVRLALRTTHNLAEGAGAAAMAAAVKHKHQLTGQRVACIMSGGNLDRAKLKWILQ